MLSGRVAGAIAYGSPVSCAVLLQVSPLSVDRTYFIGRSSTWDTWSRSRRVSRMNTKTAPSSVTNGIGYVAPSPAAIGCSVQVPSTECGSGERAT